MLKPKPSQADVHMTSVEDWSRVKALLGQALQAKTYNLESVCKATHLLETEIEEASKDKWIKFDQDPELMQKKH